VRENRVEVGDVWCVVKRNYKLRYRIFRWNLNNKTSSLDIPRKKARSTWGARRYVEVEKWVCESTALLPVYLRGDTRRWWWRRITITWAHFGLFFQIPECTKEGQNTSDVICATDCCLLGVAITAATFLIVWCWSGKIRNNERISFFYVENENYVFD